MSDQKNQESEPSIIINDRRMRFDEEAAREESHRTESPRAEAPAPGESPRGDSDGEKSLREKAEEAREGRLLALLSGMVASHLFVDPATGLPDERFSPSEARFYLDLIDLYVAARGKNGILASLPPEPGAAEKEPPRLGHVPAILGAMAVHALGVDPATGRPGGAANMEAARLYIDLLDFVATKVADSMTAEDRDYMNDILYQTKMFFVRQRDLARPGGAVP
ncbi:MAG: DUF1844 domain-containing protein [Nitrospirae bacterium]|nr:DUF1844 domain-containing protein [Nitrospirota bacterium]